MTESVSTAKIYLGSPFYNDQQRARVDPVSYTHLTLPTNSLV